MIFAVRGGHTQAGSSTTKAWWRSPFHPLPAQQSKPHQQQAGRAERKETWKKTGHQDAMEHLLGQHLSKCALFPGKGRCNPLFQGDKTLSAGDEILHRRTSLLHTHHPDTARLLHSECQHLTTDPPAPLQTINHSTAVPRSNACKGSAIPSLTTRPGQGQQPAKQLLDNTSDAAAPQKGSLESCLAPPANEVLL